MLRQLATFFVLFCLVQAELFDISHYEEIFPSSVCVTTVRGVTECKHGADIKNGNFPQSCSMEASWSESVLLALYSCSGCLCQQSFTMTATLENGTTTTLTRYVLLTLRANHMTLKPAVLLTNVTLQCTNVQCGSQDKFHRISFYTTRVRTTTTNTKLPSSHPTTTSTATTTKSYRTTTPTAATATTTTTGKSVRSTLEAFTTDVRVSTSPRKTTTGQSTSVPETTTVSRLTTVDRGTDYTVTELERTSSAVDGEKKQTSEAVETSPELSRMSVNNTTPTFRFPKPQNPRFRTPLTSQSRVEPTSGVSTSTVVDGGNTPKDVKLTTNTLTSATDQTTSGETTPVERAETYMCSFRMKNREFELKLVDKTSTEYQKLKSNLSAILHPAYKESLGASYRGIDDMVFKKGSIVVKNTISLTEQPSDDAMNSTFTAMRTRLRNNGIDVDQFDLRPTATATTTTTTATSLIDELEENALLIGLVSGLLLVVLICTIVVSALICRQQCRSKRDQLTESSSTESWPSQVSLPRPNYGLPRVGDRMWKPNSTMFGMDRQMAVAAAEVRQPPPRRPPLRNFDNERISEEREFDLRNRRRASIDQQHQIQPRAQPASRDDDWRVAAFGLDWGYFGGRDQFRRGSTPQSSVEEPPPLFSNFYRSGNALGERYSPGADSERPIIGRTRTGRRDSQTTAESDVIEQIDDIYARRRAAVAAKKRNAQPPKRAGKVLQPRPGNIHAPGGRPPNGRPLPVKNTVNQDNLLSMFYGGVQYDGNQYQRNANKLHRNAYLPQ